MRNMPPSAFALAIAFAGPLTAQSFVVDVNNGPGTNFTSISAAVAAVPDGSILRVRPGDYLESVAVVGKSLTIAADTTATIVAPLSLPGLRVAGLSATQVFVLRGMQLRSTAAAIDGELRLQNNQGLLFVDGMNDFAARTLVASHCEALLISRSRFNGQLVPGARLDTCAAVFDECSVIELRQTGGSLQLASCAIDGHAGLLAPGTDALQMQGGDLRVLGGRVFGGANYSGFSGMAIAGTGNARLTPDALIQGAPPIAPGIAAVTLDMPRTASAGVGGGLRQTSLTGAAGELGVLVLALRATPQPLPGLDPVWLDAATAQVVAAGVLGGAPVAATMLLPSSPAYTGLSLVWQGLSFGPGGAIAIGNPAWYVLP